MEGINIEDVAVDGTGGDSCEKVGVVLLVYVCIMFEGGS